MIGRALRFGVASALPRVRPLGWVFALGLIAAYVVSRGPEAGATDRALMAFMRLILPLGAFAMFQGVWGLRSAADIAWPLARFGHPRHGVAFGVAALATACSLVFSVLVGSAIVLLTSRSGALGTELFNAIWISALVALAYGGWLSLMSTFGPRGGGRSAFLALDFILGATSFFGAVFPRGHAYNLIGFDAPLGLSQPLSTVLLLVTTVMAFVLFTLRVRR